MKWLLRCCVLYRLCQALPACTVCHLKQIYPFGQLWCESPKLVSSGQLWASFLLVVIMWSSILEDVLIPDPVLSWSRKCFFPRVLVLLPFAEGWGWALGIFNCRSAFLDDLNHRCWPNLNLLAIQKTPLYLCITMFLAVQFVISGVLNLWKNCYLSCLNFTKLCCIPAQTLMLYWRHRTILRRIELVSGGILYIYSLFFLHSQHLNAEEPLYCCPERASLILLP